jgi:hypothetical protein
MIGYKYLISFFVLVVFSSINSCNISRKSNFPKTNSIFLNVGYGLKCHCTYKIDCTNKILLTICDTQTLDSVNIGETMCDSISMYIEKTLSFTGGKNIIHYDQITDGLAFVLVLYKNQEESTIIFDGIDNLKEVNPYAYKLHQFIWELSKKKGCPPSPFPQVP